MDMLDSALDVSQDKAEDSTASDEVQLAGQEDHGGIAGHAGLSLDPNIQYQFRADTGQGPVTYRVVQVATQDGSETQAQVVTTTAFPAGAQAVLQSPFNNGSSPTPDNQPETRFTYFPAVSGGAGDIGTSQGEVTNAAALGQVAGGLTTGNWQPETNMSQGQFYVMMSPQEVLQGQRNIAPRTGYTPKLEGGRSTRDDRRRATHNEETEFVGTQVRRRATHNEVERRRRDKINNWIVQLSKLVPDCSSEHTKAGQLGSKGGILAKACDYITDLRNSNARLGDSMKETERLNVDNELLRQQIEELKNENVILRTHLQQHGIVPPDINHGAT